MFNAAGIKAEMRGVFAAEGTAPHENTPKAHCSGKPGGAERRPPES